MAALGMVGRIHTWILVCLERDRSFCHSFVSTGVPAVVDGVGVEAKTRRLASKVLLIYSSDACRIPGVCQRLGWTQGISWPARKHSLLMDFRV